MTDREPKVHLLLGSSVNTHSFVYWASNEMELVSCKAVESQDWQRNIVVTLIEYHAC